MFPSFARRFIFLCFGLALATSTRASNPALPGLYEGLEVLRQHWSTWRLQATTPFNGKVSPQPTLNGPIQLDPGFISFLSFHLTRQQRALLNYSPCHLVSLLWLGEILIQGKQLKQVKLHQPSQWIDAKTYAKEAFKQTCQSAETVAIKFSSAYLEQTLRSIKPIVTQAQQCPQQVEQFWKSPEAPYYCFLHQRKEWTQAALLALKTQSEASAPQELKKIVATGLKIKELLSQEVMFQLAPLCEYGERPQDACTQLYSGNFFKLLVAKNQHQETLQHLCQQLPETKKLSAAGCAEQLWFQDQACHGIDPSLGGMIPRSSCRTMSTALLHTKLPFTIDCPSSVRHQGITQLGRLLEWFEPFLKKRWPTLTAVVKDPLALSTDPSYQPLQCHGHAVGQVMNFFEQVGMFESFWGRQMCLQDPLRKTQYCSPYLLLPQKVAPKYSVELQLNQALSRKFAINRQWNCTLVAEETFDAELLKYKTGCWILFNPKEVNHQESQFSYAIDGRLQDGATIQFNGEVKFPYDSTERKDQYTNALHLLGRELKLKSVPLQQIHELQKFEQSHPEGLIVGIGCFHHLYPQSSLKKSNVQQCQPVPFILGGIYSPSNNLESTMILHTALDPLIFPIQRPWREVMASVRAYQHYHPQQSWSLNGLHP